MNRAIKATDINVKTSVQKASEVANHIRGMALENARCSLMYCRRKVASSILKVLMSCASNAQNNFSIDIDRLYVKDVVVGKGMTLKRFSPRARGRATRVKKYYSRITVVLEESK